MSQHFLSDKYTLNSGHAFMTGIQALVRLAIVQRQRDVRAGFNSAGFISGYQGSPLGTYDMELQRAQQLLDENAIVFQPAVNEELGATAVMGTQLIDTISGKRFDGVFGIWYGKAPGIDRASDALRHANLIGVPRTGGAVIVVGDDPSAKSSTVPCASETVLQSLGVPVLFPADVQEVLDFGVHAIALSRCSGLYAGMKILTAVADGSATVDLDVDRVSPTVVDLIDGTDIVEHTPNPILIGKSLIELERTQWDVRLDAARRYITANGLNRIIDHVPDATVGIVATGKSYLDVMEALRRLGLEGSDLAAAGIRLLKIGAPFPLDPELVTEFAAGLAEIIVIEEKRAFVETFIKDALYRSPSQPVLIGKRDERGAVFMPQEGEGSPDLIARLLAGRLRGIDGRPIAYRREHQPVLLPLFAAGDVGAARTPYFCSGCPHNTSAKVPQGSAVGAGIGCHGLVMIMDEKQVGDIIGVAQMGGEGGMWMGMSAFTDVPHIYQNIGDGTFMHSGSLAVRAAVASGVNITYKLLYNSAVAMTGGQTPVGEMAAPQIVALLLAEGVKKVIITTEDTARYRKVRLPKGVEVLDRSKLVEAEERLAQIEGVTVLLHDQECAAEKRRKRKRGKMHDPQTRIFINERVCEGCGDCGEKSNCLSVEPVDTEFGRKTRINQSSCNKDYTCLGGDCPSFVEVVPAKRTAVTAATSLSAADIAEPLHRVDSDDFAMRITGIGGTGVVTVAQILATAATLDGLNVRGLDQTGMAQKGGPVVSDLRFTLGDQPRANKLAEDDCDLYLGCDVLVAAADANIEAASPARTYAVVSSAVVPTGSMVIDTDVSFPDLASLQERIANRVRPDGMHLIDARSLTQALFGSSQCENMFLVGVALQTGALPLTTKSIESAITLNGVAVEANLQAFRRGRQYIADGAEVETLARDRGRQAHAARRARRESEAAELVALVDTAPGTALHRLVSIRTAELIAYQNRRYAERYVRRVEAVRRWEAQTLQTDGAYAIAVATALFKLMAYKDESEVARLSIDGELQAAITEEFGPGARFAWKLHPPIFRALGLNHKITLGPWFKPIYQVLYLLRHLRGTPLNPFGLGNVRKLERTLIDEYVTGLEQIEQTATPQTQHLAIEIASLPDMIRGYEHIKARNVDRYRARRDELMRQLAGTEQPAAVR